MDFRAKWMIFTLAVMAACSGRPTEEPAYNVALTLVPPADPLYDLVDSASLSIDAVDMQSPFTAVYPIDPAIEATGLASRRAAAKNRCILLVTVK